MKKGFTLIELLIVMGVIAILIAIIIPSFRGMQDEGRVTKVQQELVSIQTAVESYYKNYGSFPPGGARGFTYLIQASPKILTEIPEDPFKTALVGGDKYTYSYAVITDPDTNEKIYIIGSKGLDRVWDGGTTYAKSIAVWYVGKDDLIVTNANRIKHTY